MSKPHLTVVPAGTLRLKKSMSVDDVRWAAVVSLLVNRHKMTFDGATHAVRAFIRKVRTPFHPRWFLNPTPTPLEARVVSAVCETHGADTVLLQREVSLHAHWLPVRYRLELEIAPGTPSTAQQSASPHGVPAPRLSSHRAVARCRLEMLGFSMHVESALVVLAINAFLALLATAAYAVVFGTLLYMISVLVVFAGEPRATLVAATRSFPIGLALLGALVGISAVLGRLIRASIRAARVLSGLIAQPRSGPANDDPLIPPNT